MANRLASATSPYLLQHAMNPVDWWEWGEEAFAEAVRRDVPVLLSVGYAACHWCHVMAHESFADAEIAAIINEHFVAIKVDREERPDIDAVYMRATQMLTGSGGWPMTVFLDHAGRPFHAGTYFPPQDRMGLPGLPRVLSSIADIWQRDRARVTSLAEKVAAAVRHADASVEGPAVAGDALMGRRLEADDARLAEWSGLAARAVAELDDMFDPVHGGYGGAPKFPPSTACEFLLRHHARTGEPMALTMVDLTCAAMARGGMYDQLGGGFARYSVDAAWVVPHFEKMLYDNALLARVYLHLWRATDSALAERVVRETCDFLLRELRTEQGGFASSLDADSDPVLPGQPREGAYYVWTPQQLHDVLGRNAEEIARWLSVDELGTFEHGTSVLQLLEDPRDAAVWVSVRDRLLRARAARPRPARDDKVIAGWNGLAIAALAEAGLLLGEPSYLEAAIRCAELLTSVHLREGRLLRASRDGAAGVAAGVLEDYGGVAEGLLTLYQASGEVRWLDTAAALIDTARRDFADGRGGFYDTSIDAEPLLTRPRDPADHPVPSGWSLLTGAMVTIGALTGDPETTAAAHASMSALLAHPAGGDPRFSGWAMAVREAMLVGPLEVAVIGEAGGPLHRAAMSGTSPGLVVAVGEAHALHPPLLAQRTALDSNGTAYVCRNFTCGLPTTDLFELREQVA
jgi:uncharacterized protein YyaL (SSP411 family)